jgi:hypothetical protein
MQTKWWVGKGMGQVVSVHQDDPNDKTIIVSIEVTPTQAQAIVQELSLASNAGIEILFHKGDDFYETLAKAYGVKEEE